MDNITECVSVIIPAFNEEESICESVKNVRSVLSKAGIEHEIIVVDDGSTDNTCNLAKTTGAKVIRHKKNTGYGASLKTGMSVAKNDMIVITDADGTYPSKYLPELIGKMKEADMVVGARTGQNVRIPLVRKPAKWVLGCLANYVTGENIKDLNSGLRVFRREIAEQYLNILPQKFSFTTTITVAMLCDGYDVVYMPIDYHKRTGKSKIVPWDFFNFMTLVIRLSMLFNPLKIFLPIAFTSFAIGFVKLIADIIIALGKLDSYSFASLFNQAVVSSTSLIFLLASLQILLIGMVGDGIVRKFGPRNYRKGHHYVVESDFSETEKVQEEANSSNKTGKGSNKKR